MLKAKMKSLFLEMFFYFELKTFETLYHLIGDQACIAAKTVLFGWIHIDKL